MRLEEYSKPKIPVKFSKAAFAYNRGEISEYSMKNKLKNLGWEFLNSGYYSNVYQNPNKPYILKVNSKIDTAYAQYVTLVRKIHNKHFPKISDLKFIELDGKRYYIYLIEKLEPCRDDIKYDLSLILSKIVDYPGSSFAYFERTYRNKQEVLDLLKNQPELIKVARIIGKYRSKLKVYVENDLHSGNIMQRVDGTIVITDPYS